MQRIFFDANILIAGAISRSGASHALLALAEAGMFKMVVSRLVLDEVERNLRLKAPETLPTLVQLLGHIEPDIVGDPQHSQFARWLPYIEAKDAPILEAARSANVNFLVTLNSRDFTPDVAAVSGVTILAPSALVDRIRHLISTGLS